MRPTEQGGVLLENRQELSLALNTLSAAMLDVGVGVSSTAGHAGFKDLSHKVAGAGEEGEAATLDLNANEIGVLRDACKVAEANTHYSLGVLSCFQSMTGLPGHSAVEAAQNSTNLLLRKAAVIVHTGPAAMQLSGLLDLYGGQEPTV